MKNHIKSFSLLVFLLVSCNRGPANSGAILSASEVGNGGHSVVCRDEAGKVLSVRLLDFYESKTLRDTHYSLGDSKLSLMEKVSIALERLERVDATRAKQYRRDAEKFLDEVLFVPGLKLGPTNDYGYINVPSYCTVEQFCIQKKPQKETDKRYTVSLDLWDRADQDQRAGLVLHEVIYKDALERGHKDSVSARYFTGLITSSSFDALAEAQYRDLLTRLSLGVSTGAATGLVWLKNPLALPEACSGAAIRYDLKPWVRTAQTTVFNCSHNKTTPWMHCTSDGFLEGTPDESHVGLNVFSVSASNGKEEASAVGHLNVRNCGTSSTKPPVTIQLQGRVGSLFTFALATHSQLKAKPYVFTSTSLPKWLSLSPSGIIVGTPTDSDVGKLELVLRGKSKDDDADIYVELEVSRSALWTNGSVDLGAAEVGKPFSFDLLPYVYPTSAPLTFRFRNAPAWLKISAAGQLTGTPNFGDFGVFSAVLVEVSDGTSVDGMYLSGGVVMAAPPGALSCSLSAAPNIVGVGESLTLTLVGTSAAKAGKIDGVVVGMPTATRVIAPIRPGKFRVLGEVSDGTATTYCYAEYSVSEY